MKNKHLILWLFLFLGVSLAVGIGASLLASKNTLYKGTEELGSGTSNGQASVLTLSRPTPEPDYQEIIRANDERIQPRTAPVLAPKRTVVFGQGADVPTQKPPCAEDRTPVIKNGHVVWCNKN